MMIYKDNKLAITKRMYFENLLSLEKATILYRYCPFLFIYIIKICKKLLLKFSKKLKLL